MMKTITFWVLVTLGGEANYAPEQFDTFSQCTKALYDAEHGEYSQAKSRHYQPQMKCRPRTKRVRVD
jgi:hypothetical protein